MASLEEKKKNSPKCSDNVSETVSKNNLRKLRVLKNPKFSQWMLALKSSVPQSRISLIENSLVRPTKKECENLASALNIEGFKLFPYKANREVPFKDKLMKTQQPQMEGIEGSNPLETL